MTATAEHVLEEIRTLPPRDLREVWQEVNDLVVKLGPPPGLTPAPSISPEEAMAALDRLTGCTPGSNSVERLVAERRRDRERDEAQLHTCLARLQPQAHD